MQKPVIQRSARNLYPLGEDKGALKLPGRDTAMQIGFGLIVRLLAANDELAVLDQHRQIGVGKSRHGERNAQPAAANLFDIIGWIAVR